MPDLFVDENATPVAFARVAVERGVDRYPDGLTYGVPPSMADLAAGERVRVPLGRGNTLTPGYVVEVLAESDLDPERLKLIGERERAARRLPGQLVALARWISSYYCCPLGITLASILPAAVKKNIGTVQRTLIDLADEPPAEPRPTAKQQQVLDHLATLPAGRRPVEMRALADAAGLGTVGPVKRLLAAGHLVATTHTTIEAEWRQHAGDGAAPERLTDDQGRVIDDIGRVLHSGFSVHLLHGVTGSGKTEVYVRLAEQVVAAGKVTLVLVPEIALTPQTGGRLIARFPDHRVAVLHSGLSAARRHQQWALAAAGAGAGGAPVILGARSAVFAPVPDDHLGLVIVDEEHDGSYKQDQAPRYQGRDVAIRRAQVAGVPVLLGSATPSLESWHNATVRGSFTLHRLPDRVPGTQLPRVRVVDFAREQRERPEAGRRMSLIGPTLEHAIRRALEAERQLLLLLNRRGYASYIMCPSQACGWVMNCLDCDVTVVYHRNRDLPVGGFVRCHHCGTEQRLPATCPDCNCRIVNFGWGTQRVEEEIEARFPELVLDETMLRVDSDTMHRAHDYHRALERFGSGEVLALLGTQMIAKGLDFPGVGLVGVINADTAINLPDFRASERTFQLVSQVAGRTGRGADTGLVVVQTFSPSVPAIALAAQHDYPRFARLELAARQRCGLPPWTRLARIVVRDENYRLTVETARQTAEKLRELAGTSIRVRGPAPCPIARIAARHRHQIELLAPTAAELQRLIATARSAGIVHSGALMAVDIDPVALM